MNTQECKVKPTIGPWSVFGCTVYQDDCWNAGRNEGGTRICSTYSGSPEEERDEMPTDTQSANAQFIVRACNAHEELLCACKCAVNSLDMIGATKGSSLVQQLRKAISHAEAYT